MPRVLSVALRSHPLFLSPVPTPARTPTAKAEERILATVRLIEGIPRLDALDVPELVDENHEGRPHYRTVDPRWYAREVGRRTGLEVIANKVVAHLPSIGALEQWARETIEMGVRHAVLIGGSSRYIPYPGPPVAEANEIARPLFAAHQGLLGNIAIPQRRGEAHRMVSKTRAGAAFFTTQLVFDPEAVSVLVHEYDRLCREAAITPAAVLVSFAPVADEADVEFVRWLGADIPDAAEQALLEGNGDDAIARSVDRAIEVWRTLEDRAKADRLAVPLGVNVEQVSARHTESVRRLAEAFVAALPAADARPAHADATGAAKRRDVPGASST
jgi:Methylenetetrahydrofolate reductase